MPHNDGPDRRLPAPLIATGCRWLERCALKPALRATFYSDTQIPDLTGAQQGVPTVSHSPLHRTYAEAAVDLRPPTPRTGLLLGRLAAAPCD